jgi:plasmid stabilization system protein ParE
MPRLIWSPAALRDVQRLHRYLAERNTDAARRTVKAIRNGVKMLQHQPAVGRPVDDIEPGYRGLDDRFRRRRLCTALYRIDGDLVTVLAVRHQREAGY